MSSPLEQSALRTLAYFDLTSTPLTHEELFCYLWRPPSVQSEELGRLTSAAFIFKDNYYFLPGREALVEVRRRAAAKSEAKIKKAVRAAKLLRSIPFLKAIFVSSSVAAGTATAESDIDFFIITAPGRIWLVRLFCNLILRLFGLRVYGAKRKDRICLCFFVDFDHLNLSSLRVADDDIHFIYWLHQMKPMYDPDNYHAQFLAKNKWTEKYVPNIERKSESAKPLVDSSKVGKLWKRSWEKMWHGLYGDMIEKQAKEIQWLKLKFSLKQKAGLNNNEVVITGGVLKFHENDTRRNLREKWLEKIKSFGL